MSSNYTSFIKDLLPIIKAGKLALFIGSGVSIPSGLPAWKQLFQELCERHGEEPYEDYPALATHLMDSYEITKGEICEIIEEQFDQADMQLNELHRLLKRIPVKEVITTNYDLLLEDAYAPASRLNVISTEQQCSRYRADSPKQTLFYLHGNLNHHDEMVVSSSDYQNFVVDQGRKRIALLKTLAGSRHFLFIGYSLSDPNIKAVFDSLRHLHGEEYTKKHFAVMFKEHPVKLTALKRDQSIVSLNLGQADELSQFLSVLSQAIDTGVIVESEEKTTNDVSVIKHLKQKVITLPQQDVLPLDGLLQSYQVPANLPKRIAWFTGQRDYFEQIIQQLESDTNTIAVTGLMGMGGIGKTALALEIAYECQQQKRFPDGICWHELQDKPLQQSLDELLIAFNLQAIDRLKNEVQQQIFRRILSNKRVLFILDDSNHPNRLPEILDLLAGHPIIITSRADLSDIVDFWVDISPMDNDEAIALFLRRRKQLLDDVAIEESVQTLDISEQEKLQDICIGRLGGLPLAITLAASVARKRKWSASRLQRALQQSILDLLSNVNRYQGKDHNVRISFSLSYYELSSNAQKVFDFASVFSAELFHLNALAHVTENTPEELQDLVDMLCDLHLFKRESEDSFSLHPLLREYGLKHLPHYKDIVPWQRMSTYYAKIASNEPKVLEYDWHNALLAAEWALDNEQVEDGLKLIAKIDDLLKRIGLWQWRGERLQKAYQVAAREEKIEWMYHFKQKYADLLTRQGFYQQALKDFHGLSAWIMRMRLKKSNLLWVKYVIASLSKNTLKYEISLQQDYHNLRNCLIKQDWQNIGAELRNIGSWSFQQGDIKKAHKLYEFNLDIKQSSRNLVKGKKDIFHCLLEQGLLSASEVVLDEAESIINPTFRTQSVIHQNKNSHRSLPVNATKDDGIH